MPQGTNISGNIRPEVQNQIRQIQKLIRDCDFGQADHEEAKAHEVPTDARLLAEKLQAVLMDFSFSC